MPKRALEIEETESLLDVVFGVVIALALSRLPNLLIELVDKQQSENLVSFFLLTSSLIFAAFYWIETRFFINAQYEFDSAIRPSSGKRPEGVQLPIAAFLLGTLFMMAIATGILQFANHEQLLLFLVFNSCFWLFDFGGAFVIRRAYRPHAAKAEEIGDNHASIYRWYVSHTRTWFFPVYSMLNMLFFAVLIIVNSQWKTAVVAIFTAVAILLLTLFRHLCWRTVLLEHSTTRALGQDAS